MILVVIGETSGVGKSTVAYNLGAKLGVVVVDADCEFETAQPTTRGPDLHDVCAGRASPIEAVREGGPVAILPCGRLLTKRAPNARRLARILETVEHEYGGVVVDGGLSDAMAKLPIRTVLVRTLRTTLNDAMQSPTLAREPDAERAAVAVNRVRKNAPLDDVEFERAFRAPVTPIPETSSIQRAMANGQPVGGTAGAAFDALADSVQSSMRS